MKIANERKLTIEEQKRLVILLTEAKVRGLNLDKYKTAKIGTKSRWNLDDRGYFIRADGKHYNPNPTQKAFIESKSPFKRLKSGRGGGKTASASQIILRKVMEGEKCAVFNPDFENFKLSTWSEFKEWIPWDAVTPSQRYRRNPEWEASRPFTLVFINGGKIYFKGLKDPQSARGPNINALWYDEAGRDETGLGWNIAIGSVRVGNNPQRIATYTPRSEEHWTYKFFDKNEMTEEVQELLADWQAKNPDIPFIGAFHVTSEENKDNLDPLFYTTLVASYSSGYMRTQELEGMEATEDATLGDRKWFDGHILDESPDWIWKRLRYWDLAASEQKVKTKRTKTDPDFTVGTLLGCNKAKDNFCIENQDSGQWKWDAIKANILRVAQKDGPEIPIYLEVEPGSGGINQVAELIELLKQNGFTGKGHNPRNQGDKVMRANPWFAEAAEGRFWIVKGTWNRKFFVILDGFPALNHDDEVDSVSGARHVIAPIRTWRKQRFVAVGLDGKEVTEQ